MASTLVIGVGGTGIRTLIHVKKQIQDQRPDGSLPDRVKILGLDTLPRPETISDIGAWESAHARRTAKDYEGEARINATTEYLFVGGNAHPWVCGDRTANKPGWGPDHFGTTWFDRRYFCNHPQATVLLNIRDGAGMYRQIGRLATFYALRQGPSSALFTTLRNAINGFDDQTINVIVCGSLAGGTGASMFIDIAHLVKKIAKANAKQTRLVAMMALPEAFRHTPPVVVGDDMKARATVAMRELMRFLSVHSQEIGFKMQFSDSQDVVLNSRTEGAVFSIVYLFDRRWKPPTSEAPPNPLNVRLEHGVAPTMATWITALVDQRAQERLTAGLINRESILSNMDREGLVPAVAGSTGSYSIVLPVAAIVEDWTMRLAEEALEYLVPITENGAIHPAMKGGKAGVEARQDVIEGWANIPVNVAKDIGNLGPEYEPGGNNTSSVSPVTLRSANDFQRFLFPTGAQEDLTSSARAIFEDMDENRVYFFRNAGLFSDPLKGALVQEESPRAHNNNPKSAARSLVDACDRAEQEKLAEWNSVVSKCAEYQWARYQAWLLDFASKELNGSSGLEDIPKNALRNKAGKMGWLLQYVEEMADHLDRFRMLLSEAREVRERQVESALLSIDAGKDGGKLLAMQQSHRKQKEYLETRQEILTWKRWDLLCKTELELIEKMHKYTALLRDSLRSYGQILQAGRDSISKYFDSRKQQIRAQRMAGVALEKVREIVDDEAWETEQYNRFIAGDEDTPRADRRILADFSWEVQNVTKNPGTRDAYNTPEIKLVVNGFELEKIGLLASNVIELSEPDKVKDAIRANALRLMTRCRKEFVRVWDELTVVDYLAHKYQGRTQNETPESFAEYLLEKCEVLLRLPEDEAPYRLAYLLAPKGTDAQAAWSERVLNKLQTDTNADAGYSGVLPHNDKTTLTYLAVADLVGIDKLPAYQDGMRQYLQWPKQSVGIHMSRSLNHIYRAERNAVEFDGVAQDGTPELTKTRVVALLEEESRLERFAQALAFDLIEDFQVVDQNNNYVGNVKRVVIPPREGEKDRFQREITEPYTYWLNTPGDFGNTRVPYLYAAETFCLRVQEKSPEMKSIEEMHERIVEIINDRINEDLKSKYKPKWSEGDGEASEVEDARMPDNKNRKARLRAAARRKIYQNLVPFFEEQLDRLKSLSADERNPAFPDEVEFMKVMLALLAKWIKNENI